METALGFVVLLRWRSSFVKARTALCHDDIATARPLFDEIAEALPANLEIRLYAAWARARLAESISDREHEELERLAREALGARQSLALPLCILAHGALRRVTYASREGSFTAPPPPIRPSSTRGAESES